MSVVVDADILFLSVDRLCCIAMPEHDHLFWSLVLFGTSPVFVTLGTCRLYSMAVHRRQLTRKPQLFTQIHTIIFGKPKHSFLMQDYKD